MVEVIVSDNASTDGTAKFLQNFESGRMQFRWFRQKENLGLDGNMSFLYQESKGEYVWYFSDDDVVFPNAIDRVFHALTDCAPAALLFSFVQPVGSKNRTFNYDDEVTVVGNSEQIIELLAHYPKLSIYVYKKISLAKDEWNEVNRFIGSNYQFIALGYSILRNVDSPKLCVISEPLASCDEDFNLVRFTPETWGNAWVVFKHSFVKKLFPHLELIKRQEAYYNQIQALVAVKAGALKVTNIETYNSFIRSLEVKWVWLLKNPRSLGQVFVLKFGLIPIWMKLFSRSR